MGEYALVTAAVASIAFALASIPDAQLAARLPTTVARANALVAQTARAGHVPVSQARAVLARSPYRRPPLRYLSAAGWVTGRQHPHECVLAKVTPEPTEKRMLGSLRANGRLLARLRRMNVSVPLAARALTAGAASAC